ncbi:MAG: thioredoxin family protein [Deltaproteobacteria bacterium]|nr:thioredoxin family protein [Deltaproteobacteria bacterium]
MSHAHPLAPLPSVDLAGFSTVAGAPGVTVLDFGAERCPPCRVMEPILVALAAEYAGRARIAAIDADRELELAARFNVRSLPTLVFLRDGTEVGRVIGSRSRAFVTGMLDRALRGDTAIAGP